MNNDITTVKDNRIAVVQHELDSAWSTFEQAQAAYKADHSDDNLQALEAARAKFIRVETETRAARQLLVSSAGHHS